MISQVYKVYLIHSFKEGSEPKATTKTTSSIDEARLWISEADSGVIYNSNNIKIQ
tara:strand:+ start:389 stop:553 length:165 start_codon:yes stop_codon:yes gene_type:complete